MSGVKGWLKQERDCLLVGAGSPTEDYIGPTARVEHDDTWLHIITDDYEGHAMLNIEALPYLRRALSQIAKARKTETIKAARTEEA